MKPGRTGAARVLHASYYSYKGLKAAWANEAAFRQELLAVILFSVVALNLSVSYLEKLILIGSLLTVLIVELLNSAVESVVDRISDEFHELSGRAKDMGSAAVLISIVFAMIVWICVLW